ncbi:MAG: VWA domain-containing protein [Bacteroidota bacterium]|nr:VWA domain-containing protein [Bacteroidota bacterium]
MKLSLPSRNFIVISALLFISFGCSLRAQNLVLNPSMESYTYPVIRTWPGTVEPGQSILPGWVTPTKGTADFYNSDLSVCDGYPIAKARTGEGRCALIMGLGTQNVGAYNYKEYIQGKFATPLEAGKKYCVKFFVTLDRASPYTSTGIGAYISDKAPLSYYKEPLPHEPQIISHRLITYEDGWTEISGTYVAKGGERFITIGSYSDTSVVTLSSLGKSPLKSVSSGHIMRSAYFYIDDVSVMLDDGKVCDCTIKKTEERPGDYFLFLLDISGSMDKSGNLDLMKRQLVDFTQSLNENNRISIMAFSDNAKILLPFMGPADSVEIDSTILNLKSHGNTNGNLALTRVSDIVDSLHLPQRMHVIIVTDGIFNVTEETKNYVDSLLNLNNTSFCVMQFGNRTNDDLEELTVRTPDGKYNYVNKRSLPKSMTEQKPLKMPDANTVLYTKMDAAVSSKLVEEILRDVTR